MDESATSTREWTPQSIQCVAGELGLSDAHVEPFGRGKAKLALELLGGPARAGRLILVSAINPTPAGEGKTTTSIALAMGLRRLGHRAVLALREPSLGPVFGVKGGGTGGGQASLVPENDINLHFTGDIHAISSAHNLLSAMIDNALHFDLECANKGPLDPRLVTWGRCLDMNDRALRSVLVGLGGKANGVPREERFDITAASEVMAILALAEGPSDLESRLGRIVVGTSKRGEWVTAADLGASTAMTALLLTALQPNLVQTREGGPAIVHCGPFANIAHGCNSILATRMAIQLGDYAITEAGFGLDLGGEKFLDIVCRQLGAWPRAVVLVATLRALKMHGGVAVKDAALENAAALTAGLAHLEKHLQTLHAFGLPAIVALNEFPTDTERELEQVAAAAAKLGAEVRRSRGFASGGAGARSLAECVERVAGASDTQPPRPQFTYDLADSAETKVSKIAERCYGAASVEWSAVARKQLEAARAKGFGLLPICMAKTQLSLSDDPKRFGRPEAFVIHIRELRVAAGAGFLVAITGDMMTMPGLPKTPSACNVRIEADGTIRGLMQND
jgi:formate--tetrahydrofolate ligase